ncbi:hypothetical protein ACSV4D_07185 [Flavobacterium sp. ARAG 55.4]|uniref:hypothetical protein n=1 Tax=Flavobacterium sp. ARAG 55.4 TaxID=3451357 RepID=UPI003F472F4E
MNKFAIFKKTKKIYWSTNKIYYCTLFSLLGLGYVSEKIFKPIGLIFQWSALVSMFIGIFYKFKGFTEIEPVRGTLGGNLIFEKDSIIIDDIHYSLDEINKIKISNDDYIGKLIYTSKGHIGPALSNGTNNYLIIFFKSKEPIKVFFELINSNDFQKIKPILIEYYLKKKIDFDEMTYVLGEKSRSDLQEFKKDIEKIRDSNNLSKSES